MRFLALCIYVTFIFVVVTCSKSSQQVIELERFPIDSLERIISQSSVQFDKEVSNDGNGSVKITAREPTAVRLFGFGDIGIENACLIYQANERRTDFAWYNNR